VKRKKIERKKRKEREKRERERERENKVKERDKNKKREKEKERKEHPDLSLKGSTNYLVLFCCLGNNCSPRSSDTNNWKEKE